MGCEAHRGGDRCEEVVVTRSHVTPDNVDVQEGAIDECFHALDLISPVDETSNNTGGIIYPQQ